MFPLIFAAILVIVCLVVAPSGFFAISRFEKGSTLKLFYFHKASIKLGKNNGRLFLIVCEVKIKTA